MRGLHCSPWASLVEALGLSSWLLQLSCPMACAILVSQPGIKPSSPPLEGRFLSTGPPGKSPKMFKSKLFTWKRKVKLFKKAILKWSRLWPTQFHLGFPGGSAAKNPPAVQKTQETWGRSLGREHPLEEGMVTHSSILAWRILLTEEPGGLQSIGLQRDTTEATEHALTQLYTLMKFCHICFTFLYVI